MAAPRLANLEHSALFSGIAWRGYWNILWLKVAMDDESMRWRLRPRPTRCGTEGAVVFFCRSPTSE
jgi:hypothetical protein